MEEAFPPLMAHARLLNRGPPGMPLPKKSDVMGCGRVFKHMDVHGKRHRGALVARSIAQELFLSLGRIGEGLRGARSDNDDICPLRKDDVGFATLFVREEIPLPRLSSPQG